MKQLFPRLVALLIGAYTTSSMATVLFIDVSGVGTQTAAWQSDLTALGYSYTSVSYAHGADITANLSGYSTVIVSNGDAAYTNLSANSVSKLITYLNSGGSVLYAGGHSLYSEPNAGVLAGTYFGVGNYTSNMPMFAGTAATATSGATTYNMATWAGGTYDNMLTGFSVFSGSTSTMALGTGWSGTTTGATSIAATHITGTYSAAVWGFDINHIATVAQQRTFLGATLTALDRNTTPEPESLALMLAAGLGAVAARRRIRAV